MTGVELWWTSLSAVSAINAGIWCRTAARLASRKATLAPDVYATRRRLLLLSAAFVAGCGFRSILPRADVQRICLVDTWLSSVAVGRSVATIAELCFVAQWAILLRELAAPRGARFATAVSRGIVPAIALAEVFSWSAVVTTCYLGNAIEESIWALCGALATVSFATLWPRTGRAARPLLAAALVCGAAYVAFMCTVDVPMYVSRFRADQAAGRAYLSLSDGLFDVSHRWIVTREWSDWHDEVPWMSLYFSVAVWISLALVRVPALERDSGSGRGAT